jgi:arsenite methyltransferase
MTPETISHKRAQAIRSAVKSKYQKVAINPDNCFTYPIGKESALKLGYDSSWFDSVPAAVIARFVGVGNPFGIHAPKPGDRILDAGCGCGFDTYVGASMAGPSGCAVGVDLTPEMLVVARSAAEAFKCGNVEFRECSLEKIPFEDGIFDLVISNGVLNLVPDKPAAFAEIARVLKPKGAFVSADLLVMDKIPSKILASVDAWST